MPRALRWLFVVAIILTVFAVYEEARPWRPSDCRRWGAEFISKSDLPPGYHYSETAWGSYLLCLDAP
jgi:hypothetical protein